MGKEIIQETRQDTDVSSDVLEDSHSDEGWLVVVLTGLEGFGIDGESVPSYLDSI